MHVTAVLGLVALVSAGAGAPRTVQAGLDLALQRGTLSADEHLLLRVAALRDRTQLPADLRELPRVDSDRRACVTPVLVEGYQALPRLAPGLKSRMKALLELPADLPLSVETQSPFPARVSYGDASLQTKAQQVLDAVEESYRKEVEQWGFRAPPTEAADGMYRFFLEPIDFSAAGYTSPYAEDTSTPRTDALTYIVIDSSLEGAWLTTTVAHEFNHACQVASDALEPTGFLENTASWIEGRVFPEGWGYTVGTFRYFQSQPFRPLEYMNQGNSDLYEYGGALWVHFLEERYGALDERWIANIWRGSEQDFYDNEPDYMDTLDQVLQPQGGLHAAVLRFAQDRFFVGADDDGQHLADANTWRGAEVDHAASFTARNLPVRDVTPRDEATLPQPNGCNYITLRPTLGMPPVRVSFAGLEGTAWNVDVMSVMTTGATKVVTVPLPDGVAGQVSVDPAGVKQWVLVVCHVPPPGYDPDDQHWTGALYSYSLELDVPLPTVTAVTPSVLARGDHSVLLTITGTHFVTTGQSLPVRASGAGVSLEWVQRLSETSLQVRAYVSPSAELGPRDLVVTGPTGAEGVGAGLLTVVEPSALADGGSADDGNKDDNNGPGSCGCSAVPRGAALGVLLALVPFLRARRRTTAAR